MKNLIIIMMLGLSYVTSYAQTDSLGLTFKKISSLEASLQSQSQQLSKLSSDLDAVINQNLELKNNLHLKPTIAKGMIDENVELRVLEVKGDRSTGKVHISISANNIGNVESNLAYDKFKNQIVDELGNGYDKHDRCEFLIKGRSTSGNVSYYPNTPYAIDFVINGYEQQSQFVKLLKLKFEHGLKRYEVVFQNLPIKWVDEM